MAKVKSQAQTVAKWKRNAATAGESYTEGIQNAEDWATATAAAQDNYNKGVSESISRGGFAKGVQAAGTQKFKDKALRLGPSRFTEGVAAAEGDYAKGVGPVLQVLQGINYPKKYPKGSPQNIERVKVVNQALRALKTSRA